VHHDPGDRAVVLEGRDVEGAGKHAESAAHALVVTPDDGAFLGLQHGLRETGSGTGGLVAVHALFLDEDVLAIDLESVHHRELSHRGASTLVEDAAGIVGVDVRNRQLVGLGARLLAAAAPHTSRGVDENTHELRVVVDLRSLGGSAE
jgi:hypothetical protein